MSYFSKYLSVFIIFIFTISFSSNSFSIETLEDVLNLEKKKEYDKAEEILNKMISSPASYNLNDEHLPSYYYELGKIQFLNAKYKEADNTFNKLNSLDPDYSKNNPEVKNWISKVKKNIEVLYPSESDLAKKQKIAEGQSLLDSKNYEDSEKLFLELLKKFNDSIIWYKLGESQYFLKKYESAHESFQQADELDPELLKNNERYMSIVYDNYKKMGGKDNFQDSSQVSEKPNWGLNILIFACILVAILGIGYFITKFKEGNLIKQPRKTLSDIEISLTELNERIEMAKSYLEENPDQSWVILIEEALESYNNIYNQLSKLKDGNKSINPDKLRNEITLTLDKIRVV